MSTATAERDQVEGEREEEAEAQDAPESEEAEGHRRSALDQKKAIIGGVIAALLTIAAKFAVGGVTGAEAPALLEGMLPTTRFLCGSVMTACATILALLLTLMGISSGTDSRLQGWHWRRVKWIARIDTAGFIASTVLLLMIMIPLGETENVPMSWFRIYYNSVLVASGLLAGLVITIVMMLYSTVADVVHAIGLGEDEHPMLKSE